jgi:hypothetical protein
MFRIHLRLMPEHATLTPATSARISSHLVSHPGSDVTSSSGTSFHSLVVASIVSLSGFTSYYKFHRPALMNHTAALLYQQLNF